MELNLKIVREYFTNGTNGHLFVDGVAFHYTIELPDKENHHKTSCIPEGRYELTKHYSTHLGWVIKLMNVPDRDAIYIHPANNALKELEGCIVPVTTLTGQGEGIVSRPVFNELKNKVYDAIGHGVRCFVEIESAKPMQALADNSAVQKSHL